MMGDILAKWKKIFFGKEKKIILASVARTPVETQAKGGILQRGPIIITNFVSNRNYLNHENNTMSNHINYNFLDQENLQLL